MDAYSLVCAADTAVIFAVVSGTKMLAVDPLSPVGHRVGPPWIGLVCTVPQTLDWAEIWEIWRPSHSASWSLVHTFELKQLVGCSASHMHQVASAVHFPERSLLEIFEKY